jgi:nicotinate-nucleotide adenylyltransferase
MRLAFFGGSFDPPHKGHLAIARAAADRFSLSRVLFAPTGRQPLKPTGAHADFASRLAMVEFVSTLDERFCASDLDGPRADGGANYTVDALQSLRKLYPVAEIYSLIGADSFCDFPRWHKAAQLLELSQWIVVSRPGFGIGDVKKITPTATERVHTLTSVLEDVSATNIRHRMAKGDRCKDVLSVDVSD